MKKVIRKHFRKVRRNVCRYIVGFDTCPKSLRKNRKELMKQGLACVTMCAFGVLAFFLLVLMA
jgi:hypothetical protein